MNKKLVLDALYTSRWYIGRQPDAADDLKLVSSAIAEMTGESVSPAPAPIGSPSKKVKLGIVVGHTKKAQGAVMVAPHRVSEYVYNSEIAKLCEKFAPAGMEVETFFRDSGGISGAYASAKAEECDCIIELHFNAANGKAAGTLTLCSNEGADKQFAQIIQDAMEPVFGRVDGGKGDRGLSVDPGRGGQSVTSFKGGANCLVEPFFGDNPAEAEMAMQRKEQYAKALIAGVLKWAALHGKAA